MVTQLHSTPLTPPLPQLRPEIGAIEAPTSCKEPRSTIATAGGGGTTRRNPCRDVFSADGALVRQSDGTERSRKRASRRVFSRAATDEANSFLRSLVQVDAHR